MGEVKPQSPRRRTPAELRAARGIPEIDLSGLTPTEVVAVNRYTHGQELAACDDETHRLYSRYAEAIIDAIAELPSRDREHGRAVLEALSSSPIISDRHDAANCLVPLLQADHDYGLTMFGHLL